VPTASLTFRVAVRAPVAVGVNVTVMVQSQPALRLVPQADFALKSPASVPLSVTLLIASDVLWSLVRITVAANRSCCRYALDLLLPFWPRGRIDQERPHLCGWSDDLDLHVCCDGCVLMNGADSRDTYSLCVAATHDGDGTWINLIGWLEEQ